MNLSIELEREPGLTVSQWERFLEQARRAGATSDTPVVEVIPDGTDVVCGYRVEIRDPETAAAPEQVTLPAELVQDMLNLVGEVAKSNGDVREIVEGAQGLLQVAHDNLLAPVLGVNTYWIEPTDG
jgi:hypothetical protein